MNLFRELVKKFAIRIVLGTAAITGTAAGIANTTATHYLGSKGDNKSGNNSGSNPGSNSGNNSGDNSGSKT